MSPSPCVRGFLARRWRVALAVLMHFPAVASAWTFNLQSASRRVFMYVGTATYTYNTAGLSTGVANNTTVDTMSAVIMTDTLASNLAGNSRQIINTEPRGRSYVSQWDRSATACPAGYSIIVGAGYQNSNSSPVSATVTLNSPAQMTTASGDIMPFSTITWESYSPNTLRKDDRWTERGTLGSVQTLATVPRNSVSEVCFEFTYGSPNIYPAGTYQGTITFTASTP